MDHEPSEHLRGSEPEGLTKYRTDEIEKSLSKRREAEKQFKDEKRRCQELVNGNKANEKVFEMLNRDIFMNAGSE